MKGYLVKKTYPSITGSKREKRIGRKWAFQVASTIEKAILVFDREIRPGRQQERKGGSLR